MTAESTILFVAFEFPPLTSGGVQRSLYFVKYLQENGVRPIVITPEADDLKKIFNHALVDQSLMKELAPGTIIERIHCPETKPPANALMKWMRMFFSVTENFKTSWRPELDKRLPQIIDKYKPSAIYVTIPPFAMVPLWLDILKKYPLPLIIDFRDAWSQWAIAPNGTYFHYLSKLKMERAVLEKAAAVLVSSNQTKQDLLAIHTGISGNKIQVITNGFDTNIDLPGSLSINTEGKLIIGYVGNFYYSPEARAEIFKPWWKKKPHRMLNYIPRKEDWLYRSPYFFFRALRHLLDTAPEWKNRIEVHFAGNQPAWLKEQIGAFGLESICHHTGYLNHDDVLVFQQNCHMLLITSSKVVGGKDYSIAGKTFEYFSIGKPILAFVCEGAQKDILEKSRMSVICDPDHVESSAMEMRLMLEGKTILHPDENYIHQFSRKKLTAKLAGIIKQVHIKTMGSEV